MVKGEKDILKFPPDFGRWTFELTTGTKVSGDVFQMHDNAVELIVSTDKGDKAGMCLRSEHIISCWTVIEDEVKE